MLSICPNVTDLLGKMYFSPSSLFQSCSKFWQCFFFFFHHTLKGIYAVSKNRLENKAGGISKFDLVPSIVCDIEQHAEILWGSVFLCTGIMLWLFCFSSVKILIRNCSIFYKRWLNEQTMSLGQDHNTLFSYLSIFAGCFNHLHPNLSFFFF